MCLCLLVKHKSRANRRKSTQSMHSTPTTSLIHERVCASCGQNTSMNGKYCHRCGAKLEKPTHSPVVTPNPRSMHIKYCWSCDQDVSIYAHYCSLCGVVLPRERNIIVNIPI